MDTTYSFSDSLSFLITIAELYLKTELGRQLKPYGLTQEQWAVLNLLWETNGVTQKSLAVRSLKDQPNMTRILRRLEQKGLIFRTENSEDRRSYIISITAKGQELREATIDIAMGIRRQAFAGFDIRESEQLRSMLTRINCNLLGMRNI
ncbi:MAG: MarR family transcriptional regulator [Desulfuromonadaceae bacterium]|nr:MarR family transcriptional regulator [Desulfuromonadaceae bacterium]MDD2850175.1 MarR family transcriptional regulator [Desulfuromonadaceae bacterium]MDD4129701.1 MarR family transcriptional regulator [Desulfuromonadaceae bacterium]